MFINSCTTFTEIFLMRGQLRTMNACLLAQKVIFDTSQVNKYKPADASKANKSKIKYRFFKKFQKFIMLSSEQNTFFKNSKRKMPVELLLSHSEFSFQNETFIQARMLNPNFQRF